MSKKSTWGYAKDLVEDVIEESTEDSPDKPQKNQRVNRG